MTWFVVSGSFSPQTVLDESGTQVKMLVPLGRSSFDIFDAQHP